MTTAKIAALSKCDETGITPSLANKLWPNLGAGLMAVIELIVEEHTEDSEGNTGIKLVISRIEPARDQKHVDHLRDLAQALYSARQPDGLPGVDKTVSDIIRTGKGLL